MIPHPIIRKITFTGSTPVGKQLAVLAGKHMKRVTMELGGHAPVIVAEDADLALAVKAAGGAKFRNAGQVCISPTRFLVHESIKNEFAAAMVKYSQGLKVGDGAAEGTQMGPLANPRRVTAMAEFTQDAIKYGATVALGGSRIGDAGNFWQPTVLTDVPLHAKVAATYDHVSRRDRPAALSVVMVGIGRAIYDGHWLFTLHQSGSLKVANFAGQMTNYCCSEASTNVIFSLRPRSALGTVLRLTSSNSPAES